jgi:DNA repair exonuclease SbcCD ATPase subunit
MITLKRLHANNFKGLREVDLLFPEQGSLLIEGHNEAGKSTLFEAVYVGLYGKPLVGEDERARQEEVIQHGQPRATVELVVSVGQQILTITRIFERGKPQYASLSIQQPGMQPEVVSRVRAVDERILRELGNLDGESLRNSCFVEQKELGRIEALRRSDREQAIQKLLGLERLTQLMDEFKPRREQERELASAEKHLALAKLQEKIRIVSEQEIAVAERLDAVKVASQLKRLAELAAGSDTARQRLDELTSLVQQAQARLDRCNAIKEQITRCSQVAQSLAEVSYSRRELNRTKEYLAHLERIERIDLPEAQAYLEKVASAAEAVVQLAQARARVQEAEASVQKANRFLEQLQQAEADQRQKEEDVSRAHMRGEQRRQEADVEQRRIAQQLNELAARESRLEQALDLVKQWEGACQQLYTLQQEVSTARSRQQQLIKFQAELHLRENTARERKEATERAEREKQQAAEAVRFATAYEGLTAWLRLKRVELALSGYAARQHELETSRQAAEAALLTEQRKTRTPLLISLILTILAILSLLAGFFLFPAFLLCVCFAGGAIASWIWLSRARKNVQRRSSELGHWVTEQQRLDMQRQAAIQAGGDPVALQHHEYQIREAGLEVPANLEDGQRLFEDIKQRSGTTELHKAREVAQVARDTHTRLVEQLKLAQEAVEESKRALELAQQAGDPTEQLEKLALQVTDQEQAVAQAEQKAVQSLQIDGYWPASSSDVQAVLSVCQAELRATAEAQRQQEATTARLLLEAQEDLEKAQSALLQAQESVARQRANDPASQVARSREALREAQEACRQQEEGVRQLLQKVNLRGEAEVEPERGRAGERVQALARELATRPSHNEKHEAQASDFTQKVTASAALLENLFTVAQSLSVPELPSFPYTASKEESSFPYEEVWSTTLESVKDALQNAAASLDETGTKSIRDDALGERGRLEQHVSLLEREQGESRQLISSIFSKRNLTTPPAYTYEQVIQLWPLTAEVVAEEEELVTQELEEVRRELYATRQQADVLAGELYHSGAPLSVEACQQKVDELREERDICLRANKLLREAHDRIARRVLPITERNMQPLLQQLTSGRYRDVRLTPEDMNGQPGEMDYRIRVWDPAAGRFVAKNLFSGGTRDQCSLALRLAFALATLPQELGVAPGFIFLDEPLSAFDAQRAQALVELLTTGTIAQQFSQVVLISHYHAFDREAFRYHIRLEAGQIVESDLPSGEEQELLLQARPA